VAGPGRAVPGRAGDLPVHRRGHDEPGHGARRGGARSGGRGPAAGQSGWHDSWLAAIYEVIAIAGVLVAGLYVSTHRVYLAELSDRA
jgi:hypothetical protein